MKILGTFIIFLGLCSCQSPSKENPSSEIIGNWKLTKINNKTLNKESKARIEFQKDGKVVGNNSCNNFFGSYKISANNISFGQMGSTKKLCQQEKNNLELQFNETLSQTSKFSISNGLLTITNEDNKVIEAKRGKKL